MFNSAMLFTTLVPFIRVKKNLWNIRQIGESQGRRKIDVEQEGERMRSNYTLDY